MLDIISELKAFMAVQSAVVSMKKTGALSILDAAHVGALLAIAGTFYASVKDLIPPQWGIPAGIALSLLFLAYSFVLKLHGQTAAPIPGIPALDQSQLDGIVSTIEAKYPQLVNYKAAFDAAIAIAKTSVPPAPPAITIPLPPAAAGENVTASVSVPAAPPAVPPVSPAIVP